MTAVGTATEGWAEPLQLKRGFGLRSAFSMAFADVSPIVALYTVFAIGITTAGPGFWWAFPIVLAGQLLVALVFGELASRWPYAGSVYQWARHVVGPRYGWATAWAYMWGLTIALSALAYGGAGFLAGAAGDTAPSRTTITVIAIAIIVAASAMNMIGRVFLRVFVVLSVCAEVVGSIGVSSVLLFGYHVNPLSVLTSAHGSSGGGAWLSGAFLAAVALVGWSFLGFESAGSIAEEVHEPERNVPKAIFFGLLCVGVIVMYSSFGVIMAVPHLNAVLAGTVADPVSSTLATHLGTAAAQAIQVLFVVGFTASFLAVQAAVSRCIFASARDGALPASRWLSTLTTHERLPRNAILVTAIVAIALLFISGSRVYATLISFTNAGFYTAFALPVLGSAYQRLRGRWEPGRFTLGRWGAVVTYVAAVWIVFETVNIAWPRSLYGAWYLRWAVILMSAVVGTIGVVVFWLVNRHRSRPPVVKDTTSSALSARGTG